MTKHEAHLHGVSDAYQDRCESAPFGSTGGLENRHQMKAPKWIPEDVADSYLNGYRAECERLFGPDWQTCEFTWKPVLTIGEKIEE
jgi:hypothetical protein